MSLYSTSRSVMSEASRDLDISTGENKVIPDYFGNYTREVAELLSQDEDILPFSCQTSELAGRTHRVVREKDIIKYGNNGKDGNTLIHSGSLFCDAFGSGLSDIKKERLRALLRQSVVAFTGEVDEMVDPVVSMCRLQSHLKCKKSSLEYLDATGEGDADEHTQKKVKLSSSPSRVNIPHAYPISCSPSEGGSEKEDMDVMVLGKGLSNGLKKQCGNCHMTETSEWRAGPEGPKSLCNACGIKFKQEKESLGIKDPGAELFLESNTGAEKDNGEVSDDLQLLLENDSLKVEEIMKKHSDELSMTLVYMEKKLEELLDTVMSKCRPMTHDEKIQLRKYIQNLPPRNFDNLVEIIKRRKSPEKCSCDEIHVELEDEDNVTLWRLHYYVEAVEKARKLSLA